MVSHITNRTAAKLESLFDNNTAAFHNRTGRLRDRNQALQSTAVCQKVINDQNVFAFMQLLTIPCAGSGIAMIGAILFLLGYIMRPEALRIVVMAAGALCMLSEIPAFFLFWRCPHCHALRPWHYSGKDLHCAVCGKVLESP